MIATYELSNNDLPLQFDRAEFAKHLQWLLSQAEDALQQGGKAAAVKSLLMSRDIAALLSAKAQPSAAGDKLDPYWNLKQMLESSIELIQRRGAELCFLVREISDYCRMIDQ